MSKEEMQSGEQLDLIDVTPEELKPIIELAKKYKSAQGRRLDALAEEVDYKQRLLEMIKASGLSRDEDGKIRFSSGSFKITVTPRDDLISVKELSASTEE